MFVDDEDENDIFDIPKPKKKRAKAKKRRLDNLNPSLPPPVSLLSKLPPSSASSVTTASTERTAASTASSSSSSDHCYDSVLGMMVSPEALLEPTLAGTFKLQKLRGMQAKVVEAALSKVRRKYIRIYTRLFCFCAGP